MNCRSSESSSVKKILSSKGYQYSTPLRGPNESKLDECETSTLKKKNLISRNPNSSLKNNPNLSLSLTGNSSGEDVVLSYSKYLISYLYLLKTKERKSSLESYVKNQVANILNTVQKINVREKALRDEKQKIQAEENKIKIYKDMLTIPTSDFETTFNLIHSLALALESRYSRLKVEGGPLFEEENSISSQAPVHLLEEILQLLRHIKSNPGYPEIQSLATDLTTLDQLISQIQNSYKEFKLKSDAASVILTRLESLKLSLKRVQGAESDSLFTSISVPSPMEEHHA